MMQVFSLDSDVLSSSYLKEERSPESQLNIVRVQWCCMCGGHCRHVGVQRSESGELDAFW